MDNYVYMYGQVISTRSFLLKGDFPKPDGEAEIKEKYHLVGGETGTAAAVCLSLGLNVKLAGTHLGAANKDLILNYFKDKPADTSELKVKPFDGVTDYIIIDKSTRTCFGEWERLFSGKIPFYEPPNEESIKNAACVALDACFYPEQSAELCLKYNKPYATIDCKHDSAIHRHCAINAVSHQFLKSRYGSTDFNELYKLYTDNTDGLVIFTRGENEVIYGRKGESPRYFKPYRLDIVSTLGAGDSFKAGTIYALYHKMSGDDMVKFACAVAGIACTKFPIALNPPTLAEVEELINKRKG